MLKPSIRNELKKVTLENESCFYFYDLDGLNQHLKMINELENTELKLWYACKANPLSSILKEIDNCNIGIDVASIGELEQALASGFNASNILSTGPAKSKQYLEKLLVQGVNTIVLESLTQAYWLNDIAEKLGKTPDVLLRVQIQWQGGTSVLGGDSITPFGLPPSEWKKLKLVELKHLNILGCHLFQWGNILDVNQLKMIWDRTCEELKQLTELLGIPLKVIDLGGGLGIPYSESDEEINFEEIRRLLKKIRADNGIEEIWLELGRYMVGQYGYYLSKVIDRKHVRGKDLLVLQGGINHMARPTLTNQTFPCEMLRSSRSELSEFQIHGPLCTALDELGTYQLPADITVGDWLCFSSSGAYGFTESMPFFLCHDLPAEIIFKNAVSEIKRKSVTAKSWMV